MSPGTLTRRRRAALAALLLGVVVMVAFDRWFTLLAGIALMLGAVVAGLVLVAAPGGFLDHDRNADGEDAAGVPAGDGAGSRGDDRPSGTSAPAAGTTPGGDPGSPA